MTSQEDISPLTLNRLSVYLRCLRRLEELGIGRTSSREMAQRFRLSASQIRKDLAHFGEFGIRGVGYEVAQLKWRLEKLLGLNREHHAVVVGAGNIGTALVRFPGLNSSSFRIVGAFDNAPDKVGTALESLTIRHSQDLAEVVKRTSAEIGILAVPASAAQENYDRMVEAGIMAVLNFAPIQLDSDPRARVKNVDLLIFLVGLAVFVR